MEQPELLMKFLTVLGAPLTSQGLVGVRIRPRRTVVTHRDFEHIWASRYRGDSGPTGPTWHNPKSVPGVSALGPWAQKVQNRVERSRNS